VVRGRVFAGYRSVENCGGLPSPLKRKPFPKDECLCPIVLHTCLGLEPGTVGAYRATGTLGATIILDYTQNLFFNKDKDCSNA